MLARDIERLAQSA